MELIKTNWNKEDGINFNKYLKTIGNPEKMTWSKNILRTDMNVLVIKTKQIVDMSKEIVQGNFISFLDLKLWDYYENTAINGYLICKIKDFNIMKQYLDWYANKADNWATCDLLSFNIKNNEENFLNLSKEYIKSDKPFVRRIGLSILFNYLNDEKYMPIVFKTLNSFHNEEHYYVNMMLAWLLCECFIKQKEQTIKFLQNHQLNNFVINKGIQKCRDSYRVTSEDKDMLLKYKKSKKNA